MARYIRPQGTKVANQMIELGFKKNVGRATTQVMMKTGEFTDCYPATSDARSSRQRQRGWARARRTQTRTNSFTVQAMSSGPMTETMKLRNGMRGSDCFAAAGS